jgi:LysR family glycine cleavage system transcriptional activator
MTKQHELRRPRRLTPPISALAAFEAVVRRGSFTAAAEELALTQSAVSRQVSALEKLVGVALLEQNRRRQIVLTASGAFYVERVRQMLSDLAAATTETIALGGRGRVLRLGIPPTFGSRWLMPRMPIFLDAHPDIAIEFSTRVPGRPHAGLEGLHALIDFADAPGTDAKWDELIQMELRLVATEQIARAFRRSDKTDLANIHLLVHPSERATWTELLINPRMEILRSHPTLTFENFTMLFQAAVDGLGIALAPVNLIETELSNKRLVPIMDLAIKGRSIGYLVYHRENGGYLPLKAFRTWLLDSIKDGSATAPH